MGMLQAQQIVALTTENNQLKQELETVKQALQILEEGVPEAKPVVEKDDEKDKNDE